MRPGRYFIRARGERVLYDGSFSAQAGAALSVDVAKLQRIEYARLVRKGHGAPLWSHSLELGARVRGALPNAETPCLGAFIGYGLDTKPLGVRARLGACTSSFASRRSEPGRANRTVRAARLTQRRATLLEQLAQRGE